VFIPVQGQAAPALPFCAVGDEAVERTLTPRDSDVRAALSGEL
jgi:hypothetical protein